MNRLTERIGSYADKIKIFTTHFFSKLKNDGYTQVESWVKKFNIFEKRFVFIPININDSHWILAVIVNPGEVFTQYSDNQRHEHPFCVVFDSLGGNRASTTFSPIMELLNSEAKRLGKSGVVKPFKAETFKIFGTSKKTGE